MGRATTIDHSPYPNHGGTYVGDHAAVLTVKETARIERWLGAVQDRTGVQIIVVTVRSIRDYKVDTNGSIEAFARGMFDKYGIGDSQANKGILLLVAVDDRQARIELGAGYEGKRNDDARRIMDERITPHFKEGDYGEGVVSGVKAIMLEFAGVRAGRNWLALLPMAAAVLAAPIAYSLARNGKNGWGWVCAGLVIILVLGVLKLVLFILTAIFHRESYAGRGSGGWSGSSSWGGSSSGGGSSGGGGATGSW